MVSSSRHIYFIHLSKFLFSELSCQHFSMVNMASLCDIKYTLVRTERERGGTKQNGRKREAKREGGKVRE